MAREVPAVSRPGDPHQSLLDVLGLHPASAEFHYRYAESLQHLFNRLNLAGLGNVFWDLFTASALDAPALGLLRTLGYAGDERPAVLGLYFLGGQDALQGPLVDDGPLSESEPIRPSTTTGATTCAGWSTPPAARSTRCACSPASPTTSRPSRSCTCCCATR